MADVAAGGAAVAYSGSSSPSKATLSRVHWGFCRSVLTLGIAPSVVIDVSLMVLTLLSGLASMYGFTTLVEAGIFNKEDVKMYLALLAPMVTMGAYVSPSPVVAEAIGKMSVQNLPIQVIQLQSICNVLSICYGIQIMNKAVLVTNMFGLLMQVLFLSGDHFVRSANSQWLAFSLKLSCFYNITLYIMATISPLNILGNFICLFNIAMFAAPLTKLGTILRTKNASSLPMAMTFISVLNNATWALYAILIEDIVVLMPSLLGYLLSGFQVLVILWCKGVLPFDLGFLLLLLREPSARANSSKDPHLGSESVELRVKTATSPPLSSAEPRPKV